MKDGGSKECQMHFFSNTAQALYRELLSVFSVVFVAVTEIFFIFIS